MTENNLIKEININELHNKLHEKDDFHLIDVRENHEWANGHIANAVHLPKGIITDILNIIEDKSASIVLYCAGGVRSAQAALVVQQLGYKNVLSLRGGIKEWAKANYSIVM